MWMGKMNQFFKAITLGTAMVATLSYAEDDAMQIAMLRMQNQITELQNKLAYYSAGTTVKVTVKRANGAEYNEITMDLTLGKAMTDSNATNGSGNSGNGNNGGSIDQQPAGDPNAKSGQGSGH